MIIARSGPVAQPRLLPPHRLIALPPHCLIALPPHRLIARSSRFRSSIVHMTLVFNTFLHLCSSTPLSCGLTSTPQPPPLLPPFTGDNGKAPKDLAKRIL